MSEALQLAILTAIAGGVGWMFKWVIGEMKSCTEDRKLLHAKILTLSVDVARLNSHLEFTDSRVEETKKIVELKS